MAQTVAALLVLIWGATRVVRTPGVATLLPLVGTAVAMGVLALAVCAGWGAPKLWGVGAILLFVVYVAAAHANSRLDDSNTTAWAWFAVMGIVLAVVVFLKGASDGWWPIGIAAVIVVASGVAAVDRNRLTADERRIE